MTDTIWLNTNLNRKLKIEPPALRNEKKPLFKRIGLDDVTPPVWLVKSHIEEGTFAMVFGPSGAKKSFLVYDLACCFATGKDWHGNRVKQGAVLIICVEGHGGLNRRLKGWEKYNQQSLKDVPLYGNERPLTLTDDADIEALIAYIEERIRLCQNKPPCPTASWKLTSATCLIPYPFAISKQALRSSNLQLCFM